MEQVNSSENNESVPVNLMNVSQKVDALTTQVHQLYYFFITFKITQKN